jgi:hypothetical protein
MRFMTMYSVAPEDRDEAIARFKQSQGAPPGGVTLLGRWHDVSGNRGFTLAEASDAQALYKWVLDWSDLMTFETCVVLDDAEFGQVLGAGK